MGWDINKVFLVGRLTRDIELRYSSNGLAIARLGIAVGGKPKEDGTETVNFFNAVLMGKQAENAQRFLKKGSQVAIEGHLTQNSWTTPDGQKRSNVEIFIERIQYLSKTSKDNDVSEVSSTEEYYDNINGFNPNPVDPSFDGEEF